MGWEQRGNTQYYYTAERVNGRVVKQYIGAGPVAALAAELDSLKRAEQELKAEAARKEQDLLVKLDALLAPLIELAETASVAALVATGHHRPKRGPWRKRRG